MRASLPRGHRGHWQLPGRAVTAFVERRVPAFLATVFVFAGWLLFANPVDAQVDVYYSVGSSRPTDLKNGAPTVTISGGVATFSQAQTGNVGVGDEIDYDSDNKIAYIKSVVSQTQFVVHTATGGVPGDVTGVGVNSIMRAFVDFVDAENDSGNGTHLTSYDLTATGADARLTWMAYRDSSPAFIDGTGINSYTTDATHYIAVTAAGANEVASGVSQRHTGTADTGVVIDGQDVQHFGFSVEVDYTRISWLEMKQFFDPLQNGSAAVRVAANNVLLENLLVYDFLSPMPFDHGVKTAASPVSFTIRNSIIYDGDNDGIYIDGVGDTAIVENCSFLDVDNGIRNKGTLTVTNTISMANVIGFNNSGTMNGSNNMSSDLTAPGAGSLPSRLATDQYVSITPGAEDLHLKATSEAVDAAVSLSGSFTRDIDDQVRSGSWDMGADEIGGVVCCGLSVSETASTVTVNGSGQFEMEFSTAAGGSIEKLYDLVEDPGRALDLAGAASASTSARGLHNFGLRVGAPFYNTGENDTGARIHLLESTPVRVRLRQESFYQDNAGGPILDGVKGYGDYSVYGVGRIGLRWERWVTATGGITYGSEYRELFLHYLSSGPLAAWTRFHDGGSVFTGSGQSDFLLGQNESSGSPGARTDVLDILHTDWTAANGHFNDANSTAAGAPDAVDERVNMYWQETDGETNGMTLPAGRRDTWDSLTYIKPTTFVDHSGTAVTSRSTDYRAPDVLTINGGKGSQWVDGAESTTAGTDWFNEAEAAYVLELDPTLGLDFDLDGSAGTPRYMPFFKIRQWRSFLLPATITVEGVTKTLGTDFRAAIKPVARAHFSEESWHSTFESAAATSTPAVGTTTSVSGAIAFVPGRYGNGAEINANGDTITFPAASNFDPFFGAVELWYQPSYTCRLAPGCDNTRHVLWHMQQVGTAYFILEKTAANDLELTVRNGATTTTKRVALGAFGWGASDWVHLRVTWDDTSPIPADKLLIYVDGAQPTQSIVGGPFSATGLTVGPNYIGTDSSGAGHASGVLDEFHMYTAESLPTPLAHGGLKSSSEEFLADGARNADLIELPVDANRRGQYLYFGADTKFRGLNVGLETAGAGVATDAIDWEYWNGTGWADLEAGCPGACTFGFTDGTESFTKSGSVFWTSDPTGWAPYSVSGGPDLYYVRAYLDELSPAYGTIPREGRITTDVLLFQYCEDITSAAQTFVFEAPKTTAVELIELDARGVREGVSLTWETASELNNLGFHLYRATSRAGPFERITPLIPGLGSSPWGAVYTYRDTGLSSGVTYYYELEDVETTGKTKRHGPVAATPSDAGESEPAPPAVTEDEDLDARVTYGDPAASRFAVVPQSDGVVLELETAGFIAVPRDDGTVRLEVPGLEEVAGSFLPVKRAWVDAVAGRNVQLVSVRARDVERFSGLQPSVALVTELEASRNGTVRARLRRRGRRPLRTDSAKLLEVAYQGETKKALLELSPFTWDGGSLVLAKKLEVRVAFRGREVSASRTRHVNGDIALRLATVKPGLYAVPLDEVLGRRPRRPALRLSRQGEDVAYHVEDGSLYFWSEGASENPFGTEAVYELEVGIAGKAMDVVSNAGDTGGASFRSEIEREENRYYQAGLVNAPDVWLWETLFAPERKGFSFQVSTLARAPEPSTLEVWLQGMTDFPHVHDHHVRVYVNGSYVAQTRWDGKTAHSIAVELGPGVLREGDNLLEIESVLSDASTSSMVMLDRFRVRYPRAASVLEGASYVIDITDELPRWVASRRGFDSEHVYVTVDDALRPEVRSVPSTKLRERRGADYLVIGPQAFLDAAKPLLQRRSEQGLRVARASTEAIASEFGHGELTPQSIRDVIAYAYHERRGRRLRHVLLLGDATFDYKDYLKTGVTNQVPPYIVRTSYLWAASDPTYAAIHGDDLLPDVAIGRLPARTTEELSAMVEKILAYENGERIPDAPHVLVADDADSAGDFQSDAEEIASTLLAGRNTHRIFLSELGASATRDAIVASFDTGASTLSYLGHGGIHLWADENLFNNSRVDLLSSQSTQPLLLTMNCLNGYFHFPYFDALAEALLKPRNKGVIAAFSPSGLSLNGPAHVYHEALLRELLSGEHARLGDAILAAQQSYADSGAFPELLAIYHLFGDPALVLK